MASLDDIVPLARKSGISLNLRFCGFTSGYALRSSRPQSGRKRCSTSQAIRVCCRSRYRLRKLVHIGYFLFDHACAMG